jgi:hypothetical protein
MATELRVHGVNGSAAEDVLDRPLLRRIAGDGEAGFFRPRSEYGATTGPGGADLEAYRWGNLTAGAAARALWLLLLPFMLANVAMWLRPPAGRRTVLLIRALCRLLAVSVTATYALSFVGVSVDLVGWQCAASARCTDGRPYLELLTDGFFAPTGRRLAVLALVPLGAVAFLWLLGRRTWCRYEAYPVQPDGDGDGLSHPCFWNGMPLVGRLRAIHVAAGFATVDAMLLGALVRHHREPAGVWLAGAVGALLLACLVVLCLQGMVDRDRPAGWAEPVAKALRIAAIVLTVGTLVYAGWPRAPWPVRGGLPGYGTTVTILFAAQALLLAVLGVVVLLVRRRGAFLGGLGVPVLGSLAVGVAVAFTAGMSYRVADFLDRSNIPSPADFVKSRREGLQPPASYEWAALGFVAMVVMVCLVLAVTRLWTLRRLMSTAREDTDRDFPGARVGATAARASTVDSTTADARLTDHSGRLIALAYTPLAVAAVVVTVYALTGNGPVRLAGENTPLARLTSFSVNLGTYLIGAFTLALVVLGYLAYRHPRLRRVVGVLWDLGTFWPRAAHPLAPPCYSERVVPELVTRTAYLATRGGVVLSGHSQGSVLVAATVLQLRPDLRPGVALLTYGSPLRRLYGRLFPAYVDDATLARVGENVTWVNLWRHTDPIGGVVGGSALDVRFGDPAGLAPLDGDTVPPAIQGHSGYQEDDRFSEQVSRLLGALRRPAPAAAEPAPDGAVPAG